MPSQLSSAELAAMRADVASIIDALGESATVRRLIENGNGQSIPAAAHISDLRIFVSPMTGVGEMLIDAPADVAFEGRTKVYTVPTQIQTSDLITTAAGVVYQIAAIRAFDTQLLLALNTWRDTTNATP